MNILFATNSNILPEASEEEIMREDNLARESSERAQVSSRQHEVSALVLG